MEIIKCFPLVDGVFSLESLIEKEGCLQIFLKYNGGRLIVKFDSHLVYRKGDEGDLLKVIEEINASCKLGCTLYSVISSEFIDWFLDQCYGIRNLAEIKGYIILTDNDVIEVISINEPDIVWY